MNNAEKNLFIARHEYPNAIKYSSVGAAVTVVFNINKACCPVDYCNSISDLWPLVVKYRLSINPIGDNEWVVYKILDNHEFIFSKINKDPLATIVDCIIAVIEQEKE